MVIENAYAELGLAPGASEAEVREAWRRLVSQWYPDRDKTASASSAAIMCTGCAARAFPPSVAARAVTTW